MKCFLHLSKQDLDLAKIEALSLTKKDYGIYDDLFITEYVPKLETRLGFSHDIFEFLFSCSKAELLTRIEKYDWQSRYRDNFCVRAHGLDETYLAKLIFRRLENPKVKLRNTSSRFEFFLIKDIVIAGLFIAEIDKSYLKRKAHLRPSLHPTSMHPALARACINLSGLVTGKILDPFCGSGGILIEAALMGFDTVGYDIDEIQLKRAKINLDYYGLKAKLERQDALTLKEKADAIITDIPYGKGSKVKDVEKLCNDFLRHSCSLANNLVLIYPDFIEPDFTGWKIEHEFSMYLHKSLTRKITKLHYPH